MSDLSLSFSLLTLFTSPERAVSIQGDLIEEAQSRGRGWFWSQILRTTGALCWKGIARTPLAILGLALSGGAVWFLSMGILVAGVAAIEYVLHSLGAPLNIRFLWVFLLGALSTGFILGQAAPVRGMHASVVLAVVSVPVLVLILFSPQPSAGAADVRWRVLVLAVALQLVGCALSRRRAAERASCTHE